jgi:hypothetical protein
MEGENMKKICLVALVLFGGVVFTSQGWSEEKAKPAAQAEVKAPAAQEVKTAPPAKAAKAKKGTHRAGTFVGSVVWADPGTKTITIKGRGRIVTFDASNPTFRGFRNIGDIKEGSYASVTYTSTGLRITRATRADAAAEPAVELGAEKSGAAKPVKAAKTAKGKIPRVQQKGLAFADVDENKDGKITAVELSTVMPGITIDQFKQYDRNNDGCLSEPEYRGALRGR